MCEKMSLIEISAKIEQILMMIIESGGEVTPESFDELELFREVRAEGRVNCICH
jgi:hypothetical protein